MADELGSAANMNPEAWLAKRKANRDRIAKSPNPTDAELREILPNAILEGDEAPEDPVTPPAIGQNVSHPKKKASAVTVPKSWKDVQGSADAVEALSRQLAAASSRRGLPSANNAEENFALVRAIGPRDGIESMLATHMVLNHNLVVRLAARANDDPDVAVQARAAEAVSKLQRAFAHQVDVMARHQAKAPQQSQPLAMQIVMTMGGGRCGAEKCGWVTDNKHKVFDVDGKRIS